MLRPTISSAISETLLSALLTVFTNSPLRKIVTLSAISITSSSLWLINIIALPSAFICFTTENRALASWGVSTLVGSSKIRIFAPLIKALIISTRCCSPGESCQILALGSMGQLYLFCSSAICFSTPRSGKKNGKPSKPKAIFSATLCFLAK